MTDEIKVDGADTLARTARAANAELRDMSAPGNRTANLIAGRGRVSAPRLTGALASSIRPNADDNTAEIVSALPYANRTHWGYRRYGQAAQPFLWEPAQNLEGQWMGYYEDEAEKILSHVRGA